MSDTDMVIEGQVTGRELALPDETLDEFRKRLNAFREFVRSDMRDGVDFGTIPGTPKPTLSKPGAEKLLEHYKLGVDILVLPSSRTKMEDGVLDYDLEGRVFHQRTGTHMGNVHANVNSEERRYRQARERGNQTLADQKNTIWKMGDKRIWVAAALRYTMGSEVYTQDIEDMPGGVAEEKPAAANNGAAKCPACGKGNLVERKRKSDGKAFWACDAGKWDAKTKTRTGCNHMQDEPPGQADEQPMPPEQPATVDMMPFYTVWGERFGDKTPNVARANSLLKFAIANQLTPDREPYKTATEEQIEKMVARFTPAQREAYLTEQRQKIAEEQAKLEPKVRDRAEEAKGREPDPAAEDAFERAKVETQILSDSRWLDPNRPIPDLKGMTPEALQTLAAELALEVQRTATGSDDAEGALPGINSADGFNE